MTETKLSLKEKDAISQLCKMKRGDSVIYNTRNTPGGHGAAVYDLAMEGGLNLVQRAHGKPRDAVRFFDYIAQRTSKVMNKKTITEAFNKKATT